MYRTSLRSSSMYRKRTHVQKAYPKAANKEEMHSQPTLIYNINIYNLCNPYIYWNSERQLAQKKHVQKLHVQKAYLKAAYKEMMHTHQTLQC